jgi:hypothetical protein
MINIKNIIKEENNFPIFLNQELLLEESMDILLLSFFLTEVLYLA